MVSIQAIIKSTKETKEEFFNRTYWGGMDDKYNMHVMVWNNAKDKNNPLVTPASFMTIEEARKYIEQLESEADRQRREELIGGKENARN